MTRDSIRRAIRTFVITTLALFIPGLLGWLNDLTSWAKGEGSTPFPDAHGLIYLAVSAITAGVVALVNLLWNLVEDGVGKGFLRPVATKALPPAAPGERGATPLFVPTVAAGVLAVIVVSVLLL